MSHVDQKEDIHQHSGWLIPAVLPVRHPASVGPVPGLVSATRPQDSRPLPPTNPPWSTLTVRGQAFAIPANYIQNPAARAGGEQESVTLAALFPSWRGYSDAEARLFAGNAPDSPVVRLSLRGDTNRAGRRRPGWRASISPIFQIPRARPARSA